MNWLLVRTFLHLIIADLLAHACMGYFVWSGGRTQTDQRAQEVSAAYAEGINQVTEGMLRSIDRAMIVVPASSLHAYVSPEILVQRFQISTDKASPWPWAMPMLARSCMMHAKALQIKDVEISEKACVKTPCWKES